MGASPLPEGVAQVINIMLTTSVRMELCPLHLEKTVVAGAMYLQEGDRYELWDGGPVREATEVTWAHDFQRVRVCLSELDDSFVAEARDNGWTVRGSVLQRRAENLHTWGTVPMGYLVPGRGYVGSKRFRNGEHFVMFYPEEGALTSEPFEIKVDPREEITSGSKD